MANPYKVFTTDETLEKDGIILDYGSFRIRIARAGGANQKFSNIFTARTKPYKFQMEMGTLDEKTSRHIMIECYVDSIIKDMDVLDETNSTPEQPVYIQGILDPEGVILPFNRTNAIQFFNNLPELFADVQRQSMKVSLFRKEELDEEIKNSVLTSVGD